MGRGRGTLTVKAHVEMNDTATHAAGSPEITGAPALEVSGLSHAFGRTKALDEASLRVSAGTFAVLLGQNGAGKTTLFSLITRLYSNRSGSIRIYGTEVRQDPAKALAQMGVVFQQRTLDLDLSVLQNLQYHAALHGLAPSVARPRIEQELGRAGDRELEFFGYRLRREKRMMLGKGQQSRERAGSIFCEDRALSIPK